MNNNFTKFLWKCQIDISEFTEGENHFVTLREPNTAEFKDLLKTQKKLSHADEDVENVADALDDFVSICPTLIVDHNFYTEGENPQKLSSKDVADFLKSKVGLAKSIIAEYMTKLPLAQKSSKK